MPAPYYGDFPANASVYMVFDSFAASTGASSATSGFANTDIQIYKDGGTTQRASASGITVSTSFDGSTGLQMVTIDLSDNTDAGFYATGHEYQVAVADVTIDSQTVRFWLGTFSIERANGILALLKGTNGLSNIKSDTAGIKTQTDKLTFTVANQIDANVLDWKSSAAPAMTGDAYARLGAPAGASVSADIAAVNAKTTNLPSSPAATGDAMALTTGERNSVADAILNRDMSLGTDSGSTTVRTIRQALRFLRNKWTISAGTLSVFKEDDTTVSWTGSVTTDGTASPVVGNDPAG